MRELATAELFVLAVAGFFVVSCTCFSLIARGALARVASWAPARRHLALWLLCAAPALSTLLLFVAAISPAADHCLVHDDGHAHLCFVHPAGHSPHAWLWVCAAIVSTWTLWHAVALLLRMLRGIRIVRTLVRTGSEHARAGTVLLEAPSAMCVAAGLVRPRVLVSRGLLGVLTPVQQDALFAHEQSHSRRRDALTRFTAGLLSRGYPAALRQKLLSALELAAEQACDEAAAASVGDRLVVADTILTVQRATSDTPVELRPLAVAMGQHAIEHRVHALLDPPRRTGGLWVLLTAMVGAALLVALNADAVHHLVESMLSPILH
jgi:Zn-dependent protease with chaperone function